jgi:diguanylate cyclase (GGDEF)-like protein
MVIANILMIGSALIVRTKDNETKYELEVEKEHELSDKLNLSKKELKELSEKLQRKISKLEGELVETNKKSVSVKDELTGLYMRAKHEEMLTNELYRTKRHSYTFSIIVINIDNLKNINEKHGHEVGNSLIKEMGDLFMRNVRFVDTVGRWSDTEYLILCPQTAAEDALSTANKLKGLVQKSKFFFIGTATASFGVASSRGDDTINDILRRGYTALSLAKENGKNRAEMSA